MENLYCKKLINIFQTNVLLKTPDGKGNFALHIAPHTKLEVCIRKSRFERPQNKFNMSEN